MSLDGSTLLTDISKRSSSLLQLYLLLQVMSATHVIIALSGIAFPIWTEEMMKLYDFRGKTPVMVIPRLIRRSTFICCLSFVSGTAAIIGALSFNSIVGMTMMHPVEWHAKKPEDVLAERARAKEEKYREHCLTLLKRRSTIDVIDIPSKAKWSSLRSLKEESYKEESSLIENLKVT